MENSKVLPKCRTENYPIQKTFLFSLTTRRFSGVRALEGCEKVPGQIFPQNKKVSESGGKLWNQSCFSAKHAEFKRNSTNFLKMGVLTCNFHAVVLY
jgi:hypothetical protein